jgi:hypothetical protein
VRELEWEAALAWSPLWTLVPEMFQASQADADPATRQREAEAINRKIEAEAHAKAMREQATRQRAEAQQRWREAEQRRQVEAKSERIRAQRGSMDFSRYGGQFGPTAAEIADAEARVGSATTEADVRAAHAAGPPMMEPPPGTRVFRHAIAKSGRTCVTGMGAGRCDCGFYRMTWTEAADIG